MENERICETETETGGQWRRGRLTETKKLGNGNRDSKTDTQRQIRMIRRRRLEETDKLRDKVERQDSKNKAQATYLGGD